MNIKQKMKKQFMWMIAAILVSGFTLTSCGDSDDDVNTGEEKTNDNVAAKAEVTYYVDLGANTLELADVEVTYLDENKKENTIKMTQKQWTLTRTLSASQLPADLSNHGDRFLILPAINEDLYPLII